MYPYILEIGNFKLATYGVMSALAYLSALIYLNTQKNRIQLADNIFWNLITIIIVFALLGAKIFYVIFFWQYFEGNFFGKILGALRDFRFGFVYFGGFLCAFSAGIYYVKIKKLGISHIADFFAPAIALGHSIGRLGCFFAGCCFGKPTSSIFSVRFTDTSSLVAPEYLGVSLHPTQLYEAVGNFVLFLVLHYMLVLQIAGRLKKGMVILTYCLSYGILRFVVEFFRGDERGTFIFGLSPSQIIAVAVVAIAMVVYKISKSDA